MASPIRLLWIPLGAGAHVVRFNGLVYERLIAWREHRAPAPLFHAALIVQTAAGRFTVELAPVVGSAASERGVAMTGPVGVGWGDRFAALRYELRVWQDGVIDDEQYVVSGPVEIPATVEQAERVIELAPTLPPLTWGRNAARSGDMWNSNSAVAWLLTRTGIDAAALTPPDGGRAPGWKAGLTVAALSGPNS